MDDRRIVSIRNRINWFFGSLLCDSLVKVAFSPKSKIVISINNDSIAEKKVGRGLQARRIVDFINTRYGGPFLRLRSKTLVWGKEYDMLQGFKERKCDHNSSRIEDVRIQIGFYFRGIEFNVTDDLPVTHCNICINQWLDVPAQECQDSIIQRTVSILEKDIEQQRFFKKF